MSDIEALMGLGISDEDQLRAMAERLRGRQRAADFFAMSTVEPIQQAAVGEQKRITDSAGQAGVLKKALDERRAQDERSRLQRENNLAVAKTYADARGRGLAVDISQPGVTKSIGRWVNRKTGEEVTVGFRQGVPINLITQEPMDLTGWVQQTPMSETSEMNAMAKAGGRIEGVNQMIGRMKEIDKQLTPYLEKGVPVDEIPGLGFWEKNWLTGKVVRGVQDLISEGAPQAEVYQAVAGLMNTINRTQAGLTQTKGEMERIRDETGLDVFTDPQAFANSFERIRRAIDADLSLVKASTPPRIWNMLEEQYPDNEDSIFNWSAEATELTYPKGRGGLKKTLGLDQEMSLGGPKPISEMTTEEILQELGQ